MKLIDLLEQISSVTSQQIPELEKLELSELERHLRHLENLKGMLNHVRDRKLNEPAQITQNFDVIGAAEYLKVNKQTVYNKINEGKIKVSRVGVKIIISKEELDRYLKEG